MYTSSLTPGEEASAVITTEGISEDELSLFVKGTTPQNTTDRRPV